MSVTDSILTIQDLLTEWRTLGSSRDAHGVEHIAHVDNSEYLHQVLPGVSEQTLRECEQELGSSLPGRLRALYRLVGGLVLFDGLFRLYGPDEAAAAAFDLDLRAFTRDVGRAGWLPQGAVPFAANAWDGSLHVTGMGRTPDEIVRCHPETGEILERHIDALHCVGARLSKLDELSIR